MKLIRTRDKIEEKSTSGLLIYFSNSKNYDKKKEKEEGLCSGEN